MPDGPKPDQWNRAKTCVGGSSILQAISSAHVDWKPTFESEESTDVA